MKLTHREWNTVVHALQVAAMTYKEDAAKAGDSADRRLAQQFDTQAEEARALATKIENEQE